MGGCQNGDLVPDFGRDVRERHVRERMPELLDVLLFDRTTGKNIMWGTKDYEGRGKGFGEWDEIKADLIASGNDKVIVPRVCKSKDEQRRRVQKKGEVFTPAWVCNAMNNLVDNAWFERNNAGFNEETTKGWKATLKPKTGGCTLVLQTGKFVTAEIRPVFAEELKLIGFDEHFQI